MPPIVLICATLAMSDGDSGRCHTADGERHRVRLAGIDAGEVAPFTRCRQRPDVWACSAQARATADRATERARQLAASGPAAPSRTATAISASWRPARSMAVTWARSSFARA